MAIIDAMPVQKRKIAYCIFGDPVDEKITLTNLNQYIQDVDHLEFFIQSSTELCHSVNFPYVKSVTVNHLNQQTFDWYCKFKTLPQLTTYPLSLGFVRALLCLQSVIDSRDAAGIAYDLTVFSNWNAVYVQKVAFENFFPIEGLHFSQQMSNYAPSLSWFITTEHHMPYLRNLCAGLYQWISEQPTLHPNIGIVVREYFSSQSIICHHRPCSIHLLGKSLPFDRKSLGGNCLLDINQ